MKTERIFNVPNLMILPEQVELESLQQPYFLYVGRINPIKALDKLIKGLAMSCTFIQSDYILKIAGATDGQYYHELLELIRQHNLENKVEFLGVLTGTKLSQLYAGAKWLFLVSESENFGNVVIEALCQSTPVVASKGAPWQCLESSGAGYWIDNTPSSIEKIVTKIISLDTKEYLAKRKMAHDLSLTFDVYSNMGEWVRVLDSWN